MILEDKPQSEANTPNAKKAGRLAQLDAIMASHPWYPRFLPFFIYVTFLMTVGLARDWQAWTYPILYVVQCGYVVYLLWRCRKLLPELTLSFHWLVIPVGVICAVAWIALGTVMMDQFPSTKPQKGDLFLFLAPMVDGKGGLGDGALGWTAMILRLLGMSIIVPMFEELFFRSMLLRSMSRPRKSLLGFVQWILDVPVIGEWLMQTKLGDAADEDEGIFKTEFERVPFGQVTLWGMVFTTLLWCPISHITRDWPGTIVCGIAYCLVVVATRKKGLGPVIWTHGVTNACLWAYTVYLHYHLNGYFDAWQFL